MPKDSKNFKVSEFACKCCAKNNIDQRVIDIAQALRDALGVPVRVNSGYRCEKHNARVGGVKGSYHTKGLAADLSCDAGAEKMFQIVQELWNNGMIPELKYCIYYVNKNFIHIDCGRKRKSLWEVRM